MSRQPAPKPNDGPAIWDLVIESMCPATDPIERAVVEDARARDASGRAIYGTPLQAHNGRDALRDAYEEALDLAVYIRQAIEEGRDLHATYRMALDIIYELRIDIAVRDGT